MVGVKYDAVTHTLYTEMLHEHHGETNTHTQTQYITCVYAEDPIMFLISQGWLPGRRCCRGRVELGLRWEESQESGDMLNQSDLPGAFKIYR